MFDSGLWTKAQDPHPYDPVKVTRVLTTLCISELQCKFSKHTKQSHIHSCLIRLSILLLSNYVNS